MARSGGTTLALAAAAESGRSAASSGSEERAGDWWIGWTEEVPGVNCQERSREESLETLTSSQSEALEFSFVA
ncbi:MAG: hypothetical protein F4112_03625 [Holophagales bacterium]|nr:hypothetical protein [Holophagales bacterium]MYD21757.1 hypothetical protein [Holophagales bacterium]MYI32046.1 hypothetical protein [Holophagales bacterium]